MVLEDTQRNYYIRIEYHVAAMFRSETQRLYYFMFLAVNRILLPIIFICLTNLFLISFYLSPNTFRVMMLQNILDESSADESSDSEENVVPTKRVFKPRIEYPDGTAFRERFRLTPRQADMLLNIIGPDVATYGEQQTAMTPKHKLMAALRYYASNSFYYANGDAQGNSDLSYNLILLLFRIL